jgi:hypothetical protein
MEPSGEERDLQTRKFVYLRERRSASKVGLNGPLLRPTRQANSAHASAKTVKLRTWNPKPVMSIRNLMS